MGNKLKKNIPESLCCTSEINTTFQINPFFTKANLALSLRVFVCSVAQSHPTLCDPVDCRVPGSSVHGLLLQEIFPTQGSNPGLLHWQADTLPPVPPVKPIGTPLT